MSRSDDARESLRAWIAKRNGRIPAREIADDTPLIEQRILKSLDTLDLIVFLERLRGAPIEIEDLKIGVFRDVDTIVRTFLETGGNGS